MNQNRKFERRRKRLQNRQRRESAFQQKQHYPRFRFVDEEVAPELASAVKKAVREFDFRELPSGQVQAFRNMKKDGAEQVLRDVQSAMGLVLADHPDLLSARFADISWAMTLPSIVFEKVDLGLRRSLCPIHDVEFTYVGDEIRVHFRAMSQVTINGQTLFIGTSRPAVETDQGSKIIAWPKGHCVDRVVERVKGRRFSYGAVGDLFALFNWCRRFETCTLDNGTSAFTFFDKCFGPRHVEYRFVSKLGLEHLARTHAHLYFRVGYSPYVVVGDYAVAKTLLYPGYRTTPERALLERSPDLSRAERERLTELAEKATADELARTCDYSAVQWFHENGVPQVIGSDADFFERP